MGGERKERWGERERERRELLLSFQPRSTCGPVHSFGILAHYCINSHDS